jgi:predicted transposase YdaD
LVLVVAIWVNFSEDRFGIRQMGTQQLLVLFFPQLAVLVVVSDKMVGHQVMAMLVVQVKSTRLVAAVVELTVQVETHQVPVTHM